MEKRPIGSKTDGGDDMKTGFSLPVKLAEQIERILADLHRRTGAECILLADVSGQLITAQGQMQAVDPVLVAALAAGDVAALTELARQIGEENPHGSFLHEGENRNMYIFNVAGSFIMIVIFRTGTPVGLIRLFVRRAAERLYPLTDEFEDSMG
jgi:predicted regulator of Ras-like GTPase activity (Roadblock/LC7/MglB family)